MENVLAAAILAVVIIGGLRFVLWLAGAGQE